MLVLRAVAQTEEQMKILLHQRSDERPVGGFDTSSDVTEGSEFGKLKLQRQRTLDGQTRGTGVLHRFGVRVERMVEIIGLIRGRQARAIKQRQRAAVMLEFIAQCRDKFLGGVTSPFHRSLMGEASWP